MKSSNLATKYSFSVSTNSASLVSRTSVSNYAKVTFNTSNNVASGENTSESLYGTGFYGSGDYGGLEHFKNKINYTISH